MFQLSYDPGRILLNVVQQGFWSIPMFRAYEAELLSLHGRIRRDHPGYRVLADCRDYAVQSADVSRAFATLFEMLMAENKGPYAILTATMLNRLQVRRALPQPNVRIFPDRDDAMAWLFEDGSLPGRSTAQGSITRLAQRHPIQTLSMNACTSA